MKGSLGSRLGLGHETIPKEGLGKAKESMKLKSGVVYWMCDDVITASM